MLLPVLAVHLPLAAAVVAFKTQVLAETPAAYVVVAGQVGHIQMTAVSVGPVV